MSTNPDQSTGTTTAGGLFTRNATGLVRGVAPRSAFILNIIGGHPVQPLAFGLFFAFALFPGGNFFVAGLLALPLILAFAYSFGLLATMMPRTGGDYVFVSRIINPVAGLMSSFCQTLANLLSLAFFGHVVVTLGAAPGLVAIGLIGGHPDLVSWGNSLATNKWAIFLVGTTMYILALLIHAGGTRRVARVQAWLFTIVTGGLVTCGVIALLMGKSTFIRRFNAFASPYTGDHDTYTMVINNATKAGIQVHPSFSLDQTVPLIGIFAVFAIFSWFSAFMGSELRRGKSMTTAHMMAGGGVVALLGVLVFAAIFIHTFGNSFMIAANASAVGLPKGIAAAPTYFFLISAAVGNTPLTLILVLTYLLFWVMLSYFVLTQPTRTLFAYAFDGLLPRAVTRVNERTGAPWVSLVVSFVLVELVFLWSLFQKNLVTVIGYATLIQLVSMAFVGLTAAIVPWRRRELYQASSTQKTLAGIPLPTVAGIGAALSSAFIWMLFFLYPAQFGLANKGQFFLYLAGTVGGAAVFYYAARAIRARRGFNLDLVYREIPPE